ncbi:MAG: ATP-binding protein, partial [Dehalococcoidia bacterium]
MNVNAHTNVAWPADTHLHSRPPAIGRAHEFRRLRNLLARTTRESPAAAHLTGPAGSGKTHLAYVLAAHAQAEGVHTLLALAPLASERRSFGALDQLAEQLDVRSTGSDGATARDVRAALRTHTGPLLVVLDAADRFPVADLEFAESILRQPPARRMFVLATTRSGPGERNSAAREFLRTLSSSGAETLTLKDLNEADVAAILESWFPDENLSPEFTAAAYDLTGGNAYYLACVRDRVLQMTPSTRWEVLQGRALLSDLDPLSAIEALLPSTLEGLDRRRLAALRAIALRGSATSLGDVVHITGMPPAEVHRAVERLEEVALIEGTEPSGDPVFAVTDPAVRAAVVRHTPLLTRRTMHARAADALARRLALATAAAPPASDLAALATHARRGAVVLDDVTARLVVAHAERLLERGRTLSARYVLEYALASLEAGHAPTLKAHVVALLSRACARLGDHETADRLLEGLRSTTTEPLPYPVIAARRLRRLVDAGDDRAAYALFQEHIEADHGIDARQRAQQFADASLAAFNLGRLPDAARLADEAVALAQSLGDPELESVLRVRLISMALRRGEPAAALDHARAAYSVARRSGSEKALARVAAGIGDALGDLGALGRARRWFTRAHRHARIAGDLAATSTILRMQSRRQFEQGEWTKAVETVRAGVAVDEQAHRSRSGQLHGAFARLVETALGISAPAVIGEPSIHVAPGEPPSELAIGEALALATAYEGTGRHQESLDLLLALAEACAGHPNSVRALLTDVLPAVANAAARLKDAPALKEVLDALQEAADA